MKFHEALEGGSRLATFEPGLEYRYSYRGDPAAPLKKVLHADAAGLAALGAGLLTGEDATKYLPTPLWDMAVKARLWKAFPALKKPWRQGKSETAWDTLLGLSRAKAPLHKIIAWVKALGG